APPTSAMRRGFVSREMCMGQANSEARPVRNWTSVVGPAVFAKSTRAGNRLAGSHLVLQRMSDLRDPEHAERLEREAPDEYLRRLAVLARTAPTAGVAASASALIPSAPTVAEAGHNQPCASAA